jgi:hypothetical protein
VEPEVFTFDYAKFILEFPAFADALIYPEATLQVWWNIAINFISPVNYGYLNDEKRDYAINLLTAHIAFLNFKLIANQTVGIVTSAKIDAIAVTLQPPKETGPLGFWLNQSIYGITLRALLRVWAVGGGFVGGSPARAGFRKPWGGF